MGYPCAVGIAAPLAIVRAAGEAADLGIIMRTGEAFQTFGQIRYVVLDKTGTLTDGGPAVREVVPSGDSSGDDLLAVAAAAESPSQHPLAPAIVDAARARGLAVVDPGPLRVGHRLRCRDHHRPRPRPRGGHSSSPTTGSPPPMWLPSSSRWSEQAAPWPPSPSTAPLSAPSPSATSSAPTPSRPSDGCAVAERAGIDDVHAAILPDGKADIVRRLQGDGTRVAMVGDGINDAPALTQADVGIAMGGGTDIAVESADVIILRDDVSAVLTAQDISRSSYRRTRQNVALAFLFNGVGIPLAATGLIQPVWAMIAMALSVTIIFVNSLGGRPSLLFQTIGSVGRTTPMTSEP